MDPFRCGGARFTDYNRTIPWWARSPHRTLSFEVEEALIAHSVKSSNGRDDPWARIEELVMFCREQNIEISDQTTSRIESVRSSRKSPLFLYRAASLVSRYEYEYSVPPDKVDIVLARYVSMMAHLWRLKQLRGSPKYTLMLFPTSALQSAPTTVVARIAYKGDKGTSCSRGIWGFLRDPGITSSIAYKDRFVIAQNHDIVKMWEQYVERYFGQSAAHYGACEAYSPGKCTPEALFAIIGKKAVQDSLSFAERVFALRTESNTSFKDKPCIPPDAIGWYRDKLNEWKSTEENNRK
jgi:hypothetical protein